MAMLGRFNKKLVVACVLSIVMTHVTPSQCIDFNSMLTDKVFPKAYNLLCSWTGLSVGAFIGKKIYTHWANVCPEDRARYVKIARGCRITSRFGAVPLVSGLLTVGAEAVCVPLVKKCSTDSILKKPLANIPRIVAMPGIAMTFLPAYLHTIHTNPERLSDEKIEEDKV